MFLPSLHWDCWVLLGKTSLTGWCHCIFMVSNLSWAGTAAPHPLCSGSLLPPILRLAVSELLHTSPDTHCIPLPFLSPAALTAWKRSHCTASPPFPSVSFHRLIQLTSFPPVVTSCAPVTLDSGPSALTLIVPPVPSYSWGISSPSVIPSLQSSAFFFIGFALSA